MNIVNLIGKISEKSFSIVGLLLFLGGAAVLIIVPYLVVRSLLGWTQQSMPILVHAIVLVLIFLIMIYWAWLISGDRGSQLFNVFYSLGVKWTFLFSIALLLFATVWFASLSSTLSDLGYVKFDPVVPKGEFWRIQDFYMWHFFNSIPGLKIPDTLLWAEPMKYTDRTSGGLLLAYKLLVIIPVIGSFIVWSRVANVGKVK